jgi:uncharacterized membrane protein
LITNRELTSRQLALLLAISIVGILLRFAAIDRSYWFDELATLKNVNVADLLSVVRIASEDNQPPLYNSTAFFWTSAFGFGEVAVRLLSILYGLLALFTPWLARTSLTRTQKIVIFTILCLMPLPIRYAQEARNYSLLFLMSSACLFLYYEMLAGRGKRPYLLFHLSLILLAFSHLFGLMLAVSFLAVMFWRERRATGRLGLVAYAVALSAVIIVPLLHGGSGSLAGGNFWITFSAAQLAYQLMVVFTPAGLLLLAYALVGWRRDNARAAIDSPLTMALMPFVLMLVGSVLISLNTPIVTERNLIGLIPAFALLLAWLLQGIVAHKSATITCLLLCLLLAQAVAWTFSPYLFIQQDFRSIAQHSVAANSKVCYLVPTTRDDYGQLSIFAFYVTTIFHRPDLKPELMASSEVPQDLSTLDCTLWADAALPKRGVSVLRTLPQFNACPEVPLAKPFPRLASELVSCKP